MHGQGFPHMAAAAAAAAGAGQHGLLPPHLAGLGGGLAGLAGGALGPGIPGMPPGPQMPGVPPPPPGGLGSGLLALGSVAGALVGHQYPFHVKDENKAPNERLVRLISPNLAIVTNHNY